MSPEVEIVEEDGGVFVRFSEFVIDFQRRANAETAVHVNAVERGDDLGAFFLGLAIAFACGVVHAFGPGHGKFIVVSYFLGREARVMRGDERPERRGHFMMPMPSSTTSTAVEAFRTRYPASDDDILGPAVKTPCRIRRDGRVFAVLTTRELSMGIRTCIHDEPHDEPAPGRHERLGQRRPRE